MQKKYLEIGIIRGTHGIKGELRVQPWCDSAEILSEFEQAANLRNKVLYVDRKDMSLPKGSYFIQDLIGLEVIDFDNGKKYGLLSDVSRTGANDVYHVKMENNKEQLIPAIPDVIKKIDLEDGKVLISPLKGLFDDED